MATDEAPESAAGPAGPPSLSPPASAALVLQPLAALPGARLSDELQRLLLEFAAREVTLRELISVLRGRAYDFLVLLLALPFLVPIPLPGLSMAFGAVIFLIAVRLSLGQRPWLPARLLDVALPPRFFPLVLASCRKLVRAMELFLRPRLLWITQPRALQVHALMILFASFLLLLPLPPGTNFPPGVAIVLFAAGLLERDGVFILLGYAAIVLNVVFFSLLAFFGTKMFDLCWHVLKSFFD
jgi:hypothetical protein